MNATKVERLFFGIRELAAMLGVSKGFIRLEIGRGKLKPIKRGRRVLIPKDEIKRYIDAV